jgi:hypothetical protein
MLSTQLICYFSYCNYYIFYVVLRKFTQGLCCGNFILHKRIEFFVIPSLTVVFSIYYGVTYLKFFNLQYQDQYLAESTLGDLNRNTGVIDWFCSILSFPFPHSCILYRWKRWQHHGLGHQVQQKR